LEQQRKNDEDQFQKSMMVSKTVGGKSRTHDEFMADQIKYEQHRFEKLKSVIEKEEEEIQTMYKPTLSKKT
jgi:hypothetical protein